MKKTARFITITAYTGPCTVKVGKAVIPRNIYSDPIELSTGSLHQLGADFDWMCEQMKKQFNIEPNQVYFKIHPAWVEPEE